MFRKLDLENHNLDRLSVQAVLAPPHRLKDSQIRKYIQQCVSQSKMKGVQGHTIAYLHCSRDTFFQEHVKVNVFSFVWISTNQKSARPSCVVGKREQTYQPLLITVY